MAMAEGMEGRGPSAGEARERLAALDAPIRAEVRRVVAGAKDQFDDPVLAAAVVATGRLAIERSVRVMALSLALAAIIVGFIATTAPRGNWIVAVGLYGAFAVTALFNVITTRRSAQRAIARHLPILDRSGGVVPAAAPVDDPEVRARHRRNRTRALLILLTIFALAVGTAGWISWQDSRVARTLRERGVPATATVNGYDAAGGTGGAFAGDRWDVEFQAEGRVVRTSIVSSGLDGREGDTVPIVYDEEDPKVARHADNLTARSGSVWSGLFFLVPIAALAALKGLRDRRDYGGGSAETR